MRLCYDMYIDCWVAPSVGTIIQLLGCPVKCFFDIFLIYFLKRGINAMVDKKNETKKRSERDIKNDEYKKKIYSRVTFRTRNRDAANVLERAAGKAGVSRFEYLRQAVNRQLEQDGFSGDDLLWLVIGTNTMVDRKIKDKKRKEREIKNDEYKRKTYSQILFRSRNRDAGDILNRAAAQAGIGKYEYLRQAVNRQLEADGFSGDDLLWWHGYSRHGDADTRARTCAYTRVYNVRILRRPWNVRGCGCASGYSGG